MKIFLLGKDGQLGRALNKSLSEDYEVYAYNKKELNLLDFKKLKEEILTVNPDIIINAAAYTKVDLAEQEQELSMAINANSLNLIADMTKSCKARLIHYSTDYVFDGTSEKAYQEDDLTNPINYYGYTKLEGEKNILKSGCNYFIFRTSWVVSSFGKNFVNNIIDLASKKDSLNIITDQIGVPTSVDLISTITKEFILKSRSKKNGIYHLVPNGLTSWYELARYIVNYLEKKNYKLNLNVKNINPILTKDFNSKTKRPLNSLLSNNKISKEINYKIEDWNMSIDKILDEIILKI
tara:strand:+ start:633 stop:1514 length:882 start_codon:yes stop_codon:yes gene_type:complete